MENTEVVEKRKFTRINSKFIVRHSRFSLSNNENIEVSESAMKNMSPTGILFETPIQYNLGELLRVDVLLEGFNSFKNGFFKPNELTKSKPVVILLKVVRVEMLDQGDCFEIGGHFVAVDEGDQNGLKKFVSHQIKMSNQKKGTV